MDTSAARFLLQVRKPRSSSSSSSIPSAVLNSNTCKTSHVTLLCPGDEMTLHLTFSYLIYLCQHDLSIICVLFI
jgi:hypothetical protein